LNPNIGQSTHLYAAVMGLFRMFYVKYPNSNVKFIYELLRRYGIKEDNEDVIFVAFKNANKELFEQVLPKSVVKSAR
jgi:hypothetical protein